MDPDIKLTGRFDYPLGIGSWDARSLFLTLFVSWLLLAGLLFPAQVMALDCGEDGQRACCLGEADFGACRPGNVEIPQANSGLCGGFNPFGIQSSGMCVAQTPCGGEGQRACCVGEAGFGACQAGLNEVPQANSGQCSNWLPGIQSSGVCVAQTPCGGEGQRACCLGEAGFGACQAGLNQVPQPNSGQCSNSLPGIQSSGVCVAQTPCGGEGQRACCLGEAGFGACQAGLNQVPQPNSGQCSNSLPGIQSSGVCVAQTPCGGEGQRACCIGEAAFGACQAGLNQVPQPNSGQCSNSLPGIQSSGVCVAQTPCGGEGQRACCLGEAGFGACQAGLNQVPQPNSGQCSNSLPGIQSSGVCVAQTPCGGEGQRACCLGEAGFGACQAGLNEVPQPNSGQCSNSLPGIQSSGICVPQTPCGGEGQRACCLGEAGFGACQAGLAEVSQANSGQCSNWLPGIQSSGFCAPVTPCGGKGQRACCVGEASIGACQAGLVEAPGCVGACLCTGGSESSGRCMRPELRMTEPGTNARPLAPLPEKPLRGFADLHVHMFSNLAFGGGVIVGRPYSASGGAMRALFPDFATNLDLVSFVGTPLPAVTCPPLVPNCGKTILHGDHTFLDDTAGLGTEDESGSYFGAPIFSGWPTWHSTTHQQVYYKWLERAWRGGMRLMVLLAVNNEVLCHGSKRLRDTDCNDSMKIIENQIIAAKAFERWMKQQPDGKWFEIVETPEEAVQTIRKGNLAVILGVEPDNLFNCKLGAGCTRRYVRDQLERYYNLGVRHIFPIHDFDNEFGGTAVWMDTLNAGNRVMEGEWYDAVTCNGAFSDFSLFNILSPDAIGGTLGQLLNWTTILYPAYPAGPHCNRKGLTPLGVQAIRNMMDLGIIVDVDHMSARSIRQAVVLARERGERGYPLVFGHVTPSDLYRGSRHEFMKSAAQLLEIRRLGGMVGLITTGHKSQTTTLNRTSGAPLVNDCSSSSKTFAETYLYLSEKMGLDVGFGSDFNGMAPHYGPRFGQDACEHGRVAGQQQAQLQNKKMLAYPFTLEGFAKFGRQVTGQRTYDFNYDGFAHIGLYPDLIADLGNVGVKAQDLETLFDSAAAYIRLWKRAKSLSAPPTAEDCTRWKNRRLTQLFKERCGTVAVQ